LKKLLETWQVLGTLTLDSARGRHSFKLNTVTPPSYTETKQTKNLLHGCLAGQATSVRPCRSKAPCVEWKTARQM